jgi:hypothetical protein
MKFALLLICLVIASNSYTLWDNWHNVPTKFTPNGTYTIPNASAYGWERNTLTNNHPWGALTDYENRLTQYAYWESSNPARLLFCGPKSYIHSSAVLCQRDPRYWDAQLPQYCLPHVYGEVYDWGECSTAT